MARNRITPERETPRKITWTSAIDWSDNAAMTLTRRTLLLAAAPVLGGAMPGRSPRAGETSLSTAGLDVTVWQPAATAPRPVVIFSHGFHGCDTQSRFLMNAFAAAGYLVFSPNHRDATCNGGGSRWLDPPERQFGKPASWDETTFRDRRDDIHRLVAALRGSPDWRDRIDWARFGVVGHSLGGYTALALGGAWPGWKLEGIAGNSRIIAIRGAVPGASHARRPGGAGDLYQGGTLDFGITPWLGKPNGAYDASPSPKYFVEFRRATHFAWTDIGSSQHAAIVAYGVAFLDRYLKGGATRRC